MRLLRPALTVAASLVLVVAAANPGAAATKVYKDAKGDVSKAGLDIRSVKVVNTPEKILVRVNLDGSAKAYGYPNGSMEILLNTNKKKGPDFGAFLYLRSEYFAGPMVGGVIVDREKWNGFDPNAPSCVSTMRVKSNEKLTFISFQVSKTKECLGTPKKVGVNVKTINTGKFGKKAYKKPKVDYYPKKNSFTKRIKQG